MAWIKSILSIISSISSYFQQKQLLDGGKAIERSEMQKKEIRAIQDAKESDESVDAMPDDSKREWLRNRKRL